MTRLWRFAAVYGFTGALACVSACTKSAPQATAPPEVSVAQVIEKPVKDWDEFYRPVAGRGERFRFALGYRATSIRWRSRKAAW